MDHLESEMDDIWQRLRELGDDFTPAQIAATRELFVQLRDAVGRWTGRVLNARVLIENAVPALLFACERESGGRAGEQDSREGSQTPTRRSSHALRSYTYPTRPTRPGRPTEPHLTSGIVWRCALWQFSSSR